ncbi:hypothetical protein DYB25_005374 [Aphanomyces astaci]|uniref:Zinc finger C2H2 LYAR-type domain-containing protein n=1 Tax=Aphanomyces astaci TaxID=112090 RepID=A0A396ZRG7_APHAT|nr:hypothetical protein DYB25_005374 [Aphanomyces astaci]RHX98868.1 hypothetical protein DYB36_006320 [Aphanomyces astaci]RHZ39843.1 hypothetical protein DYB31_001779 [Aphanomyces astaci]
MVFFVCEGCNETLKKNKVDAHASRCKNCWAVTCVDCQVVFKGNDYAVHTTCISEAQKYEGALYQGPKLSKQAKKNPQERWMDLVQSSTAPDPKVNQALQRIAGYDNVPRKKPKFLNFVKNSIGFTGVEDQLWTFLETEFNKLKDTEAAAKRPAEDATADEPLAKRAKEGGDGDSNGLSALASHVKGYLSQNATAVTTLPAVELTSDEKKWVKVLKSLVKAADGQKLGKKALLKAATAKITTKYPDLVTDDLKGAFKNAVKKAPCFTRDGDYIVLKI